MAEQTGATAAGAEGAPPAAPKLVPLFLVYTLGRLAIAILLVSRASCQHEKKNT